MDTNATLPPADEVPEAVRHAQEKIQAARMKEAKALLVEVFDTVNEVNGVIEIGLFIVKQLKGKLPLKQVVESLEADVWPEVKPLFDLLEKVVTAGAHSTAKLVADLKNKHGISEETALAVVIHNQEARKALLDSIGNAAAARKKNS